MKRKLLLGLITLGAASMLCGFDSAETADSVMQKMQEASAAAAGVSMDMGMNVDVAVNIGDGQTTSSLAVAMSGDFAIDASMDPFGMKMDGNMKVSALGEGEEITMKMYGVTNDAGEFETYVYTEDSTSGEAEWAYDKEEGLDMASLMEMSKSMDAAALSEWGLTFELAPEAADVNGTECYVLSTTMDSSTLSSVLAKASELAGTDLTADQDVASALAMLEGLKLNLSYNVDTATYLPVSMHMDMNGSDLTTLNALVQSMMADEDSQTIVEIVLNDVSIDATTAYGAVEPITVPQEALDAVASGEAESVDELVEEVAD